MSEHLTQLLLGAMLVQISRLIPIQRSLITAIVAIVKHFGVRLPDDSNGNPPASSPAKAGPNAVAADR